MTVPAQGRRERVSLTLRRLVWFAALWAAGAASVAALAWALRWWLGLG